MLKLCRQYKKKDKRLEANQRKETAYAADFYAVLSRNFSLQVKSSGHSEACQRWSQLELKLSSSRYVCHLSQRLIASGKILYKLVESGKSLILS